MLRPVDCVYIDALLDHLPQGTANEHMVSTLAHAEAQRERTQDSPHFAQSLDDRDDFVRDVIDLSLGGKAANTKA